MEKELHNITHVFLVGVGGIGMSALARWFAAHGKLVSGYDKTETPLTNTLGTEGIQIHYKDDPDLITDDIKSAKDETLVIYTPAVPKDHKELNYFMDNGYWVMKRSAVLGLISKENFCIAVAGTHGKTTTSSMLAHILKETGQTCSAFLGGIAKNFDSNLLLNESDEENNILVVEADEYDRSFLTLNPDIAIVTAIEPDHLDIYGDEENLKESFVQFLGQLKEEGQLFINMGVGKKLLKGLEDKISIKTYGIETGDYCAENIRIEGSSFVFDLSSTSESDSMDTIYDIKLNIPGYHNVENMAAAISTCLSVGLKPDEIKAAVATYSGVKRRFEYIINEKNKIFIDDYAHHPTEVEALLRSVKSLYPKRKITAVFQPHLFSRTRDFATDFGEKLSLADQVVLMDIYPARELPIEGVTSQIILDKIKVKDKWLVKEEDLEDKIKALNPEVLLTIGAGDIDRFVGPFKKILE
ncbi:UDP-N-acetylmuramate--L-alanine ligase [Flexithrix dorotheae]|uniref:UDP-N-acetylmuramate--L-alanine ligase n=1 Tax=Flexithrix dorotheae TaxID=70993 RepID=UPI0004760FE2|nr:UDP-N-acetylmuramate--L-alanine ligase [Flexithrix dorotheae]